MKKSYWITLLVTVVLAFLLAAGFGCVRNKVPDEPRTGEEEPKVDEALGYIGSSQCAACHADQYDGWEDNLHRRMVQDADKPGVIKGDFSKEGNPFEVAEGYSKDDIQYTIGSKWKQRYVVPEDDAFRILPAQWVVKTRSWTPYHADDWKDRDYKDLCIACHTTGYNDETEEFKEAGVGCEACHGPGNTHIQSRKKEDIVNPANLSVEKQTEVCGQCHFRGENTVKVGREDALGYKPGQNLLSVIKPLEPKIGEDTEAFFADGASKKHHQQYQDFIQSKHYKSGEVSCSTCHESHGSANEAGELPLKKATLDELCTLCHKEGGEAAPLPTPIDIDKYMPKRAKSATEQDIRSHTFKPNQVETIPKEPYGE